MAAAHSSVYYLRPMFSSIWSQYLDIGYHFLGEILDSSQIFSFLKGIIQTKMKDNYKTDKQITNAHNVSLFILTELAPRPIHSISCNVRLFVVCPLLRNLELLELETSGYRVYCLK